MLDLIREIGQTIKSNKLRTFLTGFAVAWGIFMLIILLGMARGVNNSFEDRANSRSMNVIQLWAGRTSKAYKGYKPGRTIDLKANDIEVLKNEHKGMVSDVTSNEYVRGGTVSTSKDYISGGLSGVFPNTLKNDGMEMLTGRFINDLDLKEKRKVMVLPEQNAALLFGEAEKAVGGRVNSMGLSWTVVGVYKSRWRDTSFIPFTTAKMLNGNKDNLYQLQVTVEGLETETDGEIAEQKVFETMAKEHQFAPDDKSAIYTWNRFTSYLQNQKAFGILSIAIWVIGVLTLLSGIVGVSNIMFVSVKERTHEIGIRRAIGAKPRNILVQIVCESVTITTLFGYIGVVMGMLVMQFVAKTFEGEMLKNPTVDLSIAIKVTVALIIAGSLAGLFPALRATKIKPVEALRDE